MHEEITMISPTNAIIDPRAVMVEPLYTFIANSAMPASWHSDDFADRTKRGGFKNIHKL